MSTTSSIRLSDDLRARLERFVESSAIKKNTVIVAAIEEYLARHETDRLAEEARRQSLLASRQENPDDEAWSIIADDSGWDS